MTRLLITIPVEPGARECGECEGCFLPHGEDCSDATVKYRGMRGVYFVRGERCLAAERAAADLAKRAALADLHCSCDEDGHHRPDCIYSLQGTLRAMTEQIERMEQAAADKDTLAEVGREIMATISDSDPWAAMRALKKHGLMDINGHRTRLGRRLMEGR